MVYIVGFNVPLDIQVSSETQMTLPTVS